MDKVEVQNEHHNTLVVLAQIILVFKMLKFSKKKRLVENVL
jgi:hypothetical protein